MLALSSIRSVAGGRLRLPQLLRAGFPASRPSPWIVSGALTCGAVTGQDSIFVLTLNSAAGVRAKVAAKIGIPADLLRPRWP